MVINQSMDQSVDSFSTIVLSPAMCWSGDIAVNGASPAIIRLSFFVFGGRGALTTDKQTYDVLTGGGQEMAIGMQRGEGMGSPVGSMGDLK